MSAMHDGEWHNAGNGIARREVASETETSVIIEYIDSRGVLRRELYLKDDGLEIFIGYTDGK